MSKETNYEKLRDMRISQNKARMEALGVKNIVSSLKDYNESRNTHNITTHVEDDADYIPSTDNCDDLSDDSSTSTSLQHENLRKTNKKKKMANMDDDTAATSSSPVKIKKGRGPAYGPKNDAKTVMKIEFDERGHPCGQWEHKYGQQIGYCVSRIRLTEPRWKDVDSNQKDALWEETRKIFHIEDDPVKKKNFLRDLASRFRQRKTKLIARFIDRTTAPKEGAPNANKMPWEIYEGQITEAEWRAFETYVNTDENFKKMREKGKENAKLNIHRHTMGQKSYNRKRSDWIKEQRLSPYSSDITSADSDNLPKMIDNRALEWCLAHQKRREDGTWAVPTSKPETARVVDKVMGYLTQEPNEREEGGTPFEYGEDALTRALGKKDHPGWVKVLGHSGVGVSHKKAFGKLSRQPTSSVSREEVKNMKAKWEEEVREIEAKWEERFRTQEKLIQQLATQLSAANQSQISLSMQTPLPQPVVADENRKCRLAVVDGDSDNHVIVAEGTAYLNATTLHGSALLQAYYKVSIDRILENYHNVALPVALPDGSKLLGDAYGSFIQWPASMVLFNDQLMPSMLSKKNKTASVSSCDLRSEDLNVVQPTYSEELADDEASDEVEVLKFLHGTLPKGSSFQVILTAPYVNQINNEIEETCVNMEDLDDFLKRKEANTMMMHVYIEYLYETFLKKEPDPKIAFVCPVAGAGYSIENQEDYEEKFTDVLGKGFIREIEKKKDHCRFVLYPFITSEHWVLLVIDLKNGYIYLFDSIRRPPNDQRKLNCMKILESAYMRYKANLRGRSRSNLVIVDMKCQQQNNSIDCGFYVMRYMYEICTKYRFCPKFLHREYIESTDPYTQKELDEVRQAWASFFRCTYMLPKDDED